MVRDPRETLVVALDVGGLAAATEFVDRLGETVLWYKVGLELYSAAGPEAVAMLKQRGKRVFLDLKLHDIPNTVARAVQQLAHLGVDIVDMHVTAGAEAISRAAETLRESAGEGPRPRLLGVTVLTSAARGLGRAELTRDALVAEATRRATEGQAAGLDGVVCPAAAAASIRAACGAEFALLVPGIRPQGSETGDQRWVATPRAAIRSGARWLVVGRPITEAPDPTRAAADILEEIRAAAFDEAAQGGLA